MKNNPSLKFILYLATFFLELNAYAMEHPVGPRVVGAIIKNVINKTSHYIRIQTPNERLLLIEPYKQYKNLSFSVPISDEQATFITRIYMDQEPEARLNLELNLSAPQALKREFVAKFIMQYPKFFKNRSWQFSNQYISKFFESGEEKWIFNLDMLFAGNNLQESEIKIDLNNTQTR